MSYEWLLGVIVGALVVVVSYLLRRKQFHAESDERTESIKVQAGATAFALTGAFVLLAWLTDNALAYIAGAPPRIVSPWSAMLGAMLVLYLGSTLYKKWQFSVWDDLDAAEQKQLRKRAGALLAGSAGLSVSARIALERGQNALGGFLLAFMCVELVIGFFLLMRATKRRSSH